MVKGRLFHALLILIAALSLTVSAFAPAPASTAAKSASNVYIVMMAADPVASYQGDIAGYQATKPPAGGKIERFSAAVQSYAQFLIGKHDEVLGAAGINPAAKIYDYSFALNGFAAQMTPAEAAAIARQPGVLWVVEDQMQQLETDSSPEFLGLTGPNGVHAKGITGEGVVVGVIDSGIWPEHPSFADDGSYGPPPVTLEDVPGHPACDFGNTDHNPNDALFSCNNKLIGARSYMEAYKIVEGDLGPNEYDSARDDDGHGTHTTSTAAGNAGVEASIAGNPLGQISGIAPRAHVIAYKGCGLNGCFTSDTAAAIDQSVADGVDVLNFSIGGGGSLLLPPTIAFLFAADAGVFVATSAGNEGPDPGTSGSVAPWVTSVGASTQKRFFEGKVTLGNGEEYAGVSITGGTDALPLVDAGALGNLLCDPAVPFSSDVTGKIVLCERGVVARVAKSQAVYNAGGAGMILYNTTNVDDLVSDTHWVPSVHIDLDPGVAIRAYIESDPNPTASLSGVEKTEFSPAPSMTLFSSRGPNPAAPDIIKPDVTAPGNQILAGQSPTPNPNSVPGELFQAIAGTSMSSPHVAGVYALLKQAHPHWSPAMAKSALMTTASQDVRNHDLVSQATPFDMGAGHINPGGNLGEGDPFRPGLVYNAGFEEYLGFLCDAEPSIFLDPEETCTILADAGIPTEARNLNLASIGIADVTGSETIRRTVTSVAFGKRTYEVSVEAPPGFEVTVSPTTLTLWTGHSASYEVTVTRTDAAIGEWQFGSLTWSDQKGQFNVRSPIALRASSIRAPEEVSGSGTEGSVSFDVKFGYTGAYTAAPHGLAPAVLTTDNVLQDPDQTFDPTDVETGGADLHQFTLSGAAHLRVAIPPEATEPDADLDVYVFNPAGELVAISGKPATDEQVDISLPEDGTWSVYVHGWATPGGDSDYTLYSWTVPFEASSLVIDSAPSSATLNETGTVSASWSGLDAGTQYLGAVSHSDENGILDLTLVSVDTR
jgi:subtilisin family serine protease